MATIEVEFDVPDGLEDLAEWWVNTSIADLVEMLPKMDEYSGGGGGSADLRIMGYALAELRDQHGEPEAVSQELAVWLYLLGKVARLVSDYKAGRPGKPDTLHDTTVYSMMSRRLQAVQRWP